MEHDRLLLEGEEERKLQLPGRRLLFLTRFLTLLILVLAISST